MDSQALNALKQGDVIEHGVLFAKLDPNEKLAWKVLEVAQEKIGKRITLHGYYHDVFVKKATIRVQAGVKPIWSM